MQDLNSYLEGDLERCGFILEDDVVIEVTNIAENPADAFKISADDLILYAETAVGTWHTHPRGDANLSEQDYVGFLQWPKLTHYIVGRDGVRSYQVHDGFVLACD